MTITSKTFHAILSLTILSSGCANFYQLSDYRIERQKHIAALYADKLDTIFQIVTPISKDGRSFGSGFLVSSDGLAVTAYHVVEGNAQVTAQLGTDESYVAKVVMVDKDKDIALIKLPPRSDGKKFDFNRLAKTVSIGETVYAFGNPMVSRSHLSEGTVTSVQATTLFFEGMKFVANDASATHGSSGGPVYNCQSEVIGFVDAGDDGITFAIRSEEIGEVLMSYKTLHG